MDSINSSDQDLLMKYIKDAGSKTETIINIGNSIKTFQVPLEIFKPVKTSEFENIIVKCEKNYLFLIFGIIYGQESKIAILDLNSIEWKLIFKFNASEVIDITAGDEPNVFFSAEQCYQFTKPTQIVCQKLIVKSINKADEITLKPIEKSEKNKNYKKNYLSYEPSSKKLWLFESGVLTAWR